MYPLSTTSAAAMLGRSLLLVVLCVSVDWAAGKGCPFGFVSYGYSCYLFSHDTATFEGANAFCEYFSSHLARITSRYEENFIRGYLKRNGQGQAYYAGGTDARVEGVWTWDKPFKKMTYFDWGPGEPSGHNRENCLILWPSFDYRLGDLSCSSKIRFVCETQRK